MRKIISPCGFHCIKVNHLGVRFNEQTVLEDVNLHVHCGSFHAIIGKNGAGKSTLIRAMLDDIPHTGSIEFKDTKDGKMQRLKIGYVPQSPSFDRGYPISVLDFFAAAISRWPVFLPVPKDLRQRVEECLTRVHGQGLLDKRIGALSGGELQRVLLALALEPIPQILILDEPLSGVDVGGEHLLLEMLDEIRQKYDLSILFSTHDFSTLRHYADKVILLQQTILRQGAPKEVLGSREFQSVFHLNLEEGGTAP